RSTSRALCTLCARQMQAAGRREMGLWRTSGTEGLFVCAGVECLHLSADGVGMGGERSLGEVALGPGLVVEITASIDATHQRRGITHLQLLHVGRDVADRQADATVVGAVRLRAVHQLDVMERHLAGFENAVDRAACVYLHSHVL